MWDSFLHLSLGLNSLPGSCDRWNPNQSYLNLLNCCLSFSATVTPGAKVSSTEIPNQRAMRNPAKPLLKSMSRMVISIKVLARIYFTICSWQIYIFLAFLNLHVHMARIFPFRLFHLTSKILQGLKSVNSNLTLAVRSPKFFQAKTNFLSHHNKCYINRFANFLTRDQWSNA